MKKMQGFTLLELILVIVLIGILSVVAIPRFIDIQRDAKVSIIKGFEGVLRSGVNLVRASAFLNGDKKGFVIMNYAGNNIITLDGYPTAQWVGTLEHVVSIDAKFIPPRTVCDVEWCVQSGVVRISKDDGTSQSLTPGRQAIKIWPKGSDSDISCGVYYIHGRGFPHPEIIPVTVGC